MKFKADTMIFNESEICKLVDFTITSNSNELRFEIADPIVIKCKYILKEFTGKYRYSSFPKSSCIEINACMISANYIWRLSIDEFNGYRIGEKIGIITSRDGLIRHFIAPFLCDLVLYAETNANKPPQGVGYLYSKEKWNNEWWQYHLDECLNDFKQGYGKYANEWFNKFDGVKITPKNKTKFDVVIDGRFRQVFDNVSPSEIEYKRDELYIQGLRCPILDKSLIKSLFCIIVRYARQTRGRLIIFMKSNGAIEFMYDGNGLSWKRKEWFKLHPHLIDDDE